MAKICFIGLGHMGQPMALNLLKAGHSLQVYDLVPEAMQILQAAGAKPLSSSLEGAKEADIIFTMLQTEEQVLKTCLGEQGLFKHLAAQTLYIDCSSIKIAASETLHREAEKLNLMMLDAPVSGGVSGALAATLTIMAGGPTQAFERAKPILETLGKKIIHAGPAGRGQAAKICNNLILGISMIAVCEGFNLAEKCGLDLKTFFEISSNASGQCWSMTSYCPAPHIIDNVPSNQHYQPGFMAKMMLKDLDLAKAAALAVQAHLPLGDAAEKLFSQFVEQGYGELDFSGIIKLIQG